MNIPWFPFLSRAPVGFTGATPDVQIGSVTTVAAGQPAAVTIGGTVDIPLLNFWIPCGPAGGSGPSFAVTMPTVTTLSTNDKNAVAFQPRADGPAALIVNANVGGVLALNTKITVSMCATQGGTYVDVCAFTLNLAVGGIGIGDGNSGTVFVPSGYWVKITLSNTGIISSVGGTKVVWNL